MLLDWTADPIFLILIIICPLIDLLTVRVGSECGIHLDWSQGNYPG